MHNLSGSSKGYSFNFLSEKLNRTLHIFDSEIDFLVCNSIKNSGNLYCDFAIASTEFVILYKFKLWGITPNCVKTKKFWHTPFG